MDSKQFAWFAALCVIIANVDVVYARKKKPADDRLWDEFINSEQGKILTENVLIGGNPPGLIYGHSDGGASDAALAWLHVGGDAQSTYCTDYKEWSEKECTSWKKTASAGSECQTWRHIFETTCNAETVPKGHKPDPGCHKTKEDRTSLSAECQIRAHRREQLLTECQTTAGYQTKLLMECQYDGKFPHMTIGKVRESLTSCEKREQNLERLLKAAEERIDFLEITIRNSIALQLLAMLALVVGFLWKSGRCWLRPSVPNRHIIPHGAPGPVAPIVKRKRKRKIKLDCVICMATEINCVISPCSHLAVCLDCAAQLRQCPVCRADIHYVQRVYRA